MRLLGIDYGEKRVGLALSDEVCTIATPHKTLANDERLLTTISKIVRDEGVEAMVVGESRDFKGAENPLMKDIRAFAVKLSEHAGLPVHFEPEMLTSAQAARHETKREMRDASAAALILQSFLDKKQTNDR